MQQEVLPGTEIFYVDPYAKRLPQGYTRLATRYYGTQGMMPAYSRILYTRVNAGRDYPSYDLSKRAKLYDRHDQLSQHLNGVLLHTAMAWAWNLATELSPTASSAAECARVIKERYAAWLLRFAEDPVPIAPAMRRNWPCTRV